MVQDNGPMFTPGRELSRWFFDQSVSPIIGGGFPQLRFAVGLLGPGSDVLGYDTVRSMDHDWGPRCTLILTAADEEVFGPHLREALNASLPMFFQGHPVMFQAAQDNPNVSVPVDPERDAPSFHRVEVTSLPSFLSRLDYEAGDELDAAFWLSVTEQQLLEYTSGAVFRDDDGELTRFRYALSWFPDDVWCYRMGAMWKRIAQIEPFVGRTGEVGDEVGSSVIGARLVEDIMRLACLQARHYAPYSKWLGTAFSRLDDPFGLQAHLATAQAASTWRGREAAIVSATSALVHAHNALGITSWIDPAPRLFYDRPFTVIDAERVSNALAGTLRDTAISQLPPDLGGIDQFMDSTDARGNPWLRRTLRTAMRQVMFPHG